MRGTGHGLVWTKTIETSVRVFGVRVEIQSVPLSNTRKKHWRCIQMAAWWDMKKSKNLVEQDVMVTVSKRTEICRTRACYRNGGLYDSYVDFM